MRMWMINPKLLCKQHLLGEHNEIHKHKSSFEKRHSIVGRVKPVVQIEPRSMKKRHEELAEEMLSRGYNHKSPYEMPDISYLDDEFLNVKVDKALSKKELKSRCVFCERLIKNNK